MKTKMLLAGLACAIMATSAQATEPSFGNCGEPPHPNVDWHGCVIPTHEQMMGQPALNLIGANLSGANLKGANFSGANLSGANLTGAKLKDAILNNVRVSPQTLWKSGKPCTGSKVSTCPKK